MTSSKTNTILSYFKSTIKEISSEESNKNIIKRESLQNPATEKRFEDRTAEHSCVANDELEIVPTDRGDSFENSEDDDKAPYYLNYFLHILISIIEDKFFQTLFNEWDKECVERFHTLSEKSKQLYVRLFQRSYRWLRHTKIKYPAIDEDLTKCFEEVIEKGFLHSSDNLTDVSEALHMLSLFESKNLAKKFKIKGNTKRDIVKNLLNLNSQYKPLFTNQHSGKPLDRVLKCSKEVLGPCYKLTSEARSLFIRMILLFNLPFVIYYEDDPMAGQTKQLLMLLRLDQGLLSFPDYNVLRTVQIFSERSCLLRYETAKTLEFDFLDSIADKNLDLACNFYLIIRKNYDELFKKMESSREDHLPEFLRRFTAQHVYVRCLSHAVEVFQRKKQYEKANEILQALLNQKVYCQEYRGKWWERLVLNMDQHLKKKSEALSEIHKALEEDLSGEYFISLVTRGHALTKLLSKDNRISDKPLPNLNLREAPEVEILGKLFSHNTSRKKLAFLSRDGNFSDSGDVFILSVEELALQHYKEKGFTEGIHGESGTMVSLYFLLFWDVIYKSGIPDVFHSTYQMFPLDLKFAHFYLSRKEDIENTLRELQDMSDENMVAKVRAIWKENVNKQCLVSWNLFSSLEQVEGLVTSIGRVKLAGICQKLASDFVHYRSGAPDLLVWNPSHHTCKFVEVKGPTDRLSVRQRLWIDYLLFIGVDVEVCYVKATGAKRIKRDSAAM